MSKHNSGFGDMLLGMILGGIVGYTAALLSAPHSGRETRDMLNEKSRELRDRAAVTLEDTREKTGKLIETGRGKVEETLARTRDRAVDVKDQVMIQGEDVVRQKREDLSEGLRKVADSVDPNADDLTMPSI